METKSKKVKKLPHNLEGGIVRNLKFIIHKIRSYETGK
ncbi:hypothetical protein M091_1574 [Parabacteroides distasonis str. 3776 D15 i]|uniref:Uncharacterized protein n=1 Tax=Parabacteroides distasonis str. 3776 D15 i TaxID=1339342 RepID=A0AB34L8Z9_PARDI|nr:hypothetical protein M091_1574 [Parabacteroides distasonis str. 3776 D15 i]